MVGMKSWSLAPNRQPGIALGAVLLVLALAAGIGGLVCSSKSPRAVLEQAAAHGDPAWGVVLTMEQDRLRTERDTATFTVATKRAGHLLVFQADTDGKSLDLVFPNELDKDSAISVGALHLPRSGWQFKMGGPAGEGSLLAVVVETVPDRTSVQRALAEGRLPEIGTNYGAALARYWETNE